MDIIKEKRGNRENCKFSVLIPSWNNLLYLLLYIDNLLKNSVYPHQIIVFVNNGADDKKRWIEKQHFDSLYSPENTGVCYALNACRTMMVGDLHIFRR